MRKGGYREEEALGSGGGLSSVAQPTIQIGRKVEISLDTTDNHENVVAVAPQPRWDYRNLWSVVLLWCGYEH